MGREKDYKVFLLAMANLQAKRGTSFNHTEPMAEKGGQVDLEGGLFSFVFDPMGRLTLIRIRPTAPFPSEHTIPVGHAE